MEKFKYSGKNLDEAKEIALKTLNCNESDIYIKENETKSGLFKAKKVEPAPAPVTTKECPLSSRRLPCIWAVWAVSSLILAV